MTPGERQMISGLFDRIRSQSGAQRDPQAEALISDSVRAQPYAPYLLAQTVLVQEQALSAASEKINALEAQIQAYESANHQQPQSGGFLSNIGKSIFGSNEQPPQRPFAPPPQQGYPPQQNYAPPQNYPQQQAPGPWGQQPQQGGLFGGSGGFMRGALGMAAGVAGGALLADGIRDLVGGHQGANVENVFVEQPSGGFGNDTGGLYPADDGNVSGQDDGLDSNFNSNDDYNV